MSTARIAPSRLAGTLALAAAFATSPATHGAGEYLVQDLGQTIVLQGTEASPPLHALLDGVAYFFRDDGIHGRELWRSDGTPLGTYMLRDNCPGACGSEFFYMYGVVAATGTHVFFTADDGIHGAEPWVTDGTALGTRMIADLAPGPASSEPDLYRAAFGQAFFQADDGVHGFELWRTDGTAQGTHLVVDLPAPDSYRIRGIHLAGGLLYFHKEDGSLYRTDGTAAGTVSLLVDAGVYPWSGYVSWAPFAELPGGDLLFQACQPGPGIGDCELWRTDGSVAGTHRVVDLEPGPNGSDPLAFYRIGNEVVFEAQGAYPNRLFRTDGTAAGTVAIPLPPDVNPRLSFGRSGVVGDRLFFTGYSSALGSEPWVWDGATASLVADLAPGAASSLYGNIYLNGPLFADVGGAALLLADDGVSGLQLWRSDGTAGGTIPLSDLGAPPADSYVALYQALVRPIVVGGKLLFTLYRPDRGFEIWASDGTSAQTAVLRTLADLPSGFVGARVRWLYARTYASCFATADQGLYFAVLGSDPFELRDFAHTNGQPGQVELLRSSLFQSSTYGASACAVSGNSGLALAGAGSEAGLWYSDGTAAGTALLFPLDLGEGWYPLFPAFGSQGNRLVFAVGTSGLVDTYLFRPRAAGPEVQALGPLSTVSWGQVVEADERLFFGGSSGLEVTDGASQPIPIYGDPVPPLLLDLDDFAWTGTSLFFSHWDAEEGPELWRSEGDAASTGPVRNLRPGPEGGFPDRGIDELYQRPVEPRIAAVGPDRVVFSGDDGILGQELWTSDGTEAGTVLVADVMPGPDPSGPRHLVSAGAFAYFAAEDPATGLELYRTNGKAAGTALVRDIVPGPGSSIPEELAVHDGILYFSAWTPTHGREAWRSDGTFSGTYRLTDVAPGPLSSSPSRFRRVGDLLLFVANDHAAGFELWARPLTGSELLFADGFEAPGTARWSASVQ